MRSARPPIPPSFSACVGDRVLLTTHRRHAWLLHTMSLRGTGVQARPLFHLADLAGRSDVSTGWFSPPSLWSRPMHCRLSVTLVVFADLGGEHIKALLSLPRTPSSLSHTCRRHNFGKPLSLAFKVTINGSLMHKSTFSISIVSNMGLS